MIVRDFVHKLGKALCLDLIQEGGSSEVHAYLLSFVELDLWLGA